ncbi:STAS domain-containing protein [Umezawaea sp. Da 62-37]|uniref:STAS domain-containing protein n=1 Tax=Umezawaea sp. Da 62-37 TaxID=3075927 RepID=UPI0028F70015|nr:STAS domain-containing protein [Umezawaea sp. Da 62-37]WNV83015.1 STAS domain-containing protein [Umezawaea sp. Da 62-37]
MSDDCPHDGPARSGDAVTDVASVYLVDATPVVVVDDEIDMHTAPALEAVLAAAFTAVRTPSPVVLDLAAVAFFSCAGLTVLVRFHHLGLTRDTPLRVVADTHSVLLPIRATGLHELLEIHPTLAVALERHGPPD